MMTRRSGTTFALALATALAVPLAAHVWPASQAAAATETPLGQYTVSDVAERVSPAVVSITTEIRPEKRPARGRRGEAPPEFPNFFFGPNLPFNEAPRRPEMGVASGVIISNDGFIVTNNHVVRGATDVKVKLLDGREYTAKLIGTDEASDLALVRIDGKDLPFLKLGDSVKLRLGEIVLAVGNPFGVGQTVTMGIVSAKGRSNMGIVDYEDFIQTDAAINPGNSGGALVNLQGELVGINTAILSRSGGAQGVGFAVPSSMVRPIIDQIREHGHVRRGWLGVAIQDLTPSLAKGLDVKQEHGVVISDVLDRGPADKAGVQTGDVVVALNGQPVTSASQLRNQIAMLGPSATVKMTVNRRGSTRDIELKLEQKKDEGEEKVAASQDEGTLQGLGLQDLNQELRRELEVPAKVASGVVVTDVDPMSKAARAGLQEGDIIVSVNRKPVGSVSDLRAMGIDKGRALLRVWRGRGFLFIVLNG